jgi:Tfp pilus assembly protein PilV
MQVVYLAKKTRGVSLVEALVAFLVMGLGLLALSSMQMNLSFNADVARQRSEAVRLAERHIDKLRSYTSLTTGAINWSNLASVANDSVIQSNTAYTLTAVLVGATADALRSVNVDVTWTDRTGAAQSVSMATVIAQTNPQDIGDIVNPLPLNTPLKRPKNRNINIPVPAVDLGNGLSSYAFDSTRYVIFSNINASVTQVCNPGTGTTTATVAQILSGTCTIYQGYILAGYVYTTNASVPSGISLAGVTLNNALGGQSPFCQTSAAVDQNSGATIPNYKYYFCVIPLTTPFTWSGTVRLAGVPRTGSNVVCRYQYASTAVSPNERNIQPYTNVDRSLDQQNYYISTFASAASASLAGTSCPTPPVALPSAASGVSLYIVHQDCRSANGASSTECP